MSTAPSDLNTRGLLQLPPASTEHIDHCCMIYMIYKNCGCSVSVCVCVCVWWYRVKQQLKMDRS